MRYAAGHKQQARHRLVAALARSFRSHGFGGIGVDGLARAAHLTSGGFYGHFPSKEAAFSEALATGLEELRAAIETLRAERGADWLAAFVDIYLVDKRLCDLAEGCTIQTLTPEVQCAGEAVRDVWQRHMARIVEVVAGGLSAVTPGERVARAWALLATLSGAVTLARACADPRQAEAIAQAARAAALTLAGTQPPP